MSAMASQITSLHVIYSTVYSGADQRKHQNSGSLAFVRAIHRWPVNSPHKGPVIRKMFPCDDVIMKIIYCLTFIDNRAWISKIIRMGHGNLLKVSACFSSLGTSCNNWLQRYEITSALPYIGRRVYEKWRWRLVVEQQILYCVIYIAFPSVGYVKIHFKY